MSNECTVSDCEISDEWTVRLKCQMNALCQTVKCQMNALCQTLLCHIDDLYQTRPAMHRTLDVRHGLCQLVAASSRYSVNQGCQAAGAIHQNGIERYCAPRPPDGTTCQSI